MPPVGFESMISAGERPQTHALDRAATGTGDYDTYHKLCFMICILLSKFFGRHTKLILQFFTNLRI